MNHFGNIIADHDKISLNPAKGIAARVIRDEELVIGDEIEKRYGQWIKKKLVEEVSCRVCFNKTTNPKDGLCETCFETMSIRRGND